MRMTKGLSLFFLLLFMSLVAETKALEEALSFYRQGQFPAALQKFENLESFEDDPHLLYNAGSAALQWHLSFDGEKLRPSLALALKYLHMAQALKPADEDIQYQVDYAIQELANKNHLIREKTLLGIQVKHLRTLLFSIALLSLSSLSFYLCLRLLRKQNIIQSQFFIILLTTIALYSLAFSLPSKPGLENWVLSMEKNLVCRTNPTENARTAFKVNEGSAMEILESRGKWVRVYLREIDSEAWVESKKLLFFTFR